MRPMEATTLDSPHDCIFPVLASPKFDGVRAVVVDGVVYSKRLKPIPNKFVQERFGRLNGYDGELILGDPTSKTCFGDTQSAVMCIEGQPDVRFYIYDRWTREGQHQEIDYLISPHVVSVLHTVINNATDLIEYIHEHLDLGYEGAMTRPAFAKYKFGRSTKVDQCLVKWKKQGLQDSEAIVLGVREKLKNNNPKELQPNGTNKRPVSRGGLAPTGTLGSLLAKDIHSGIEFSCGSGFTNEQRLEYWNQDLVGKIFTYQYQGTTKNKPRFPIFKGWRDIIDI